MITRNRNVNDSVTKFKFSTPSDLKNCFCETNVRHKCKTLVNNITVMLLCFQ